MSKELKKGDKVVVAGAYYGGHYGHGTLVKISPLPEYKGQWIVDLDGVVLLASPERIVLAEDFQKLQDKKLLTDKTYIGSIEYEIMSYLLYNKDGLKEHLKSVAVLTYIKQHHTEDFEEDATNEIIDYVSQALNKDYEKVATTINKNFLIDHLGKDFFDL